MYELIQKRNAAHEAAKKALSDTESAERRGDKAAASAALKVFEAAMRDFDSLSEKIDGRLVAGSVGPARDRMKSATAFLEEIPKPLAAKREVGSGWVDEAGESCTVRAGESVLAHLVARGKASGTPQLGIGAYLRAVLVGPKTEAERRALAEQDVSTGGALVPEAQVGRFIDRLRRESIIFRAGALTIPMENSEVKLARLKTGITPTWSAEGGSVNVTDPTFESVQLKAKTLSAVVKVSRQLAEDAINGPEIIESELSGAFAEELDRVGLRGSGVGEEPAGISSTTGTNEQTGIGALSNWDKFLTAVRQTKDSNAPDPSAIVVAPRDWEKLSALKDTTNQYLAPPAAIAPIPLLTSTALPTNLGAGSNESEAIVGAFSELLVGIRTSIQIVRLEELYAANLQVGFLAFLRADFALAHEKSFAILRGITP